jgi:hypothetical protein
MPCSHRPAMATAHVSMVLCKHKSCSTMVMKEACRHYTWHILTQYMDQYQDPMATLSVTMVLCKPKSCSTMVMPQEHKHNTWHVPLSVSGHVSNSCGYTQVVPCDLLSIHGAQADLLVHPIYISQVSMALCKPKPCSTMVMKQAHRHHTQQVPWTSHGYTPSVHGIVQA